MPVLGVEEILYCHCPPGSKNITEYVIKKEMKSHNKDPLFQIVKNKIILKINVKIEFK